MGVPIDLLRRRPDIRRAELLAAGQSARIGVAKADLYPKFTLLGSIGLVTSEDGGRISNKANLIDLFNVDSFTYAVGPTFSWPIFNYERLQNNVRIQDARFQQLIINYKNTVLEAAREVENALTEYLRTQRRVKFLKDSVTESKHSVEIALVQYRAGLLNYQRVLDSQRFLVQQRDRLAESQGNVAINLVAAYKALGGGWQIREGPAPMPAEVIQDMKSRVRWGDHMEFIRSDTPDPLQIN